MGVQVREFFRANPPMDESQERLVARLTERLAHADALIAQHRAGLIAEHAERKVLAGVGLSEAALAAVKQEVAELEQTIKTSGAARAEHVGASSSLADVTREVLNLVGMLDGLNRYRYRRNPELLAEWELATHVRAAPRRHAADAEGEDSGAGQSPEGPKGASAA